MSFRSCLGIRVTQLEPTNKSTTKKIHEPVAIDTPLSTSPTRPITRLDRKNVPANADNAIVPGSLRWYVNGTARFTRVAREHDRAGRGDVPMLSVTDDDGDEEDAAAAGYIAEYIASREVRPDEFMLDIFVDLALCPIQSKLFISAKSPFGEMEGFKKVKIIEYLGFDIHPFQVLACTRDYYAVQSLNGILHGTRYLNSIYRTLFLKN